MEKKQKTKKVPAGGGGDEKKEHKKSWREYTATVEDIQQYLSDHIMLRYNLITRRVECYLLKWLVAMVAGWLDDEVVNHMILTFIGKQGIYTTLQSNAYR